jgi:hypothetical protein
VRLAVDDGHGAPGAEPEDRLARAEAGQGRGGAVGAAAVADQQLGLVLAGEQQLAPAGQVPQLRGGPLRGPQRGAVVYVQRHRHAGAAGGLGGGAHRGPGGGAERRGDAGQVQHPRRADAGLVQVAGLQAGAGAAAPVVDDAGELGGAVLLDHQPGRRVRVQDGGVHVDPLGPEPAEHELAQLVRADPAHPGGGVVQAADPDRHVRLGAGDAHPHGGGVPQRTDPVAGEQRHGLAEGDQPRRRGRRHVYRHLPP